MAMAMAMRGLDRLAIAVHSEQPPSDEEWAQWIALCRDRPGALRVLVETHGGGPNAKQRKALNDALGSRDMRAAILTESLLVRGVVTALAWLGIPLRAFTFDQVRLAADYLELSDPELTHALETLRELVNECAVDQHQRAS
jgi:hypothetical protein